MRRPSSGIARLGEGVRETSLLPRSVPSAKVPGAPSARYLVTGLLVLLFLASSPDAGGAQSERILSLQDCIDLAVQNGPAARAASLRFAESGWNYHSYQASLRPILTLDGSAPGVERSITEVTQGDGTVDYVEQNRVSSSFDLSLDQAIPLTGGSLSLGSSLRRTDEFGNIDRTQWQTTPLAVRIDQPLFRFNSLGWEKKTAPRRYDLAHSNYLSDLEGVSLDVADRFFGLYVATLELKNAEANAAVNDTIYTLSRGRYDIGMIAENDLLQSELALINSQTQLADLRIEYEESLRDLKIDLGLGYEDRVAILPPMDTPRATVDPTRAVRLARENRPDFVSMELQDLESDREIARARSSNRLTADVSASYGLNQSGETLDAAYRDPLDSQRFNVGFRVPLLGWGRNRAAVEAATAAANRTSLENDRRRRVLDQEVYFEATRFGLLEQQIRTAAKADTVASRRFEVARNRYLIGKIGITELFDAQQEKDSANTRYVATLRSYWVAFYRLRQLTLYDFVAERPIGE